MDDSLLTAILKSDDTASVDVINPETGEYVLTTAIDLEQAGVASRPLDERVKNAVVDSKLLQREARGPLPDIPVRVLRYMFVVHACFAAAIMTVSYGVYYILNYDETHRPQIIAIITSSTCIGVLYAMVTVIVLRRGYNMDFVAPLLGAFGMAWIICLGAFAALIHNIVPLQAATVCFAQCLSVYGYTLSSPLGIDPLYALVYMIIAALIIWLLGLYGFIVQQAWISSGMLFVFGVCNAMYLSWQIHRAHRYCLSKEDRARACVNVYLDPALEVLRIVGKKNETGAV